MEVGLGPIEGCSAKVKKKSFLAIFSRKSASDSLETQVKVT
jgi:hypothetical protein